MRHEIDHGMRKVVERQSRRAGIRRAVLRPLATIAIFVGVLPAAAPATVGAVAAADPTADVERSLLEATFACLQQAGLVRVGDTQATVLGGVSAAGAEVAPTGAPVNASACAAAASSQLLGMLTDHPDQPVDSLVSQYRASVRAGARIAPTAPAALDVPSAQVAKALPNVQRWIDRMNRKLDMSGRDFIDNYGSPASFDWSSDECSAPLAGNSPYHFGWPCRRHDFGWRNLKLGEVHYPNHDVWNISNKAVVDRQFRDDLYLHCDLNYTGPIEHPACIVTAKAFHFAVSHAHGNTWGIERHTLHPF
jgi:Prokaryotic phospholipase A2